jgi:hypothetical protein
MFCIVIMKTREFVTDTAMLFIVIYTKVPTDSANPDIGSLSPDYIPPQGEEVL